MPGEGRVGRRRLVAVGLVVVLVGGVGWFGWWLRHPAPLDWGGYSFRAERPVGEAVWASMSDPPLREHRRRVVTLESIEPVGLAGGDAEVDYFVCQLDPDEAGDDAFGVGSNRDAREMCRRLLPAQGATLDLVSDPRQQLLVRVTTNRPGAVRIAGHEVTYADGWRSRTQVVAPGITVRARG